MRAKNTPELSRGGQREQLLAAVNEIGPLLEADAAKSDGLRKLSASSVEALRDSGLLALKMPTILGGDEADPSLQFEVFERAAYFSASAAWCLCIYADAVGRPAAHLSDAGLSRFLANGVPTVCGGGGAYGLAKLTPVEAGYRLNGSWGYGSGIDGAEWVSIAGLVARDDGTVAEIRSCIVPREALQVEDNWQVLGLKGTGSVNYSAHDVFVPAEMTFAARQPPYRGGPLYRLGIAGYVAHTIPAVALGVVRRCLDELTQLAAHKARGYATRIPLAQRPVFQNFLGEADQKLKAARALMMAMGNSLIDDVTRLGKSPPENEADARAAGAYAIRIAVEVMNGIVRYAGGEGTRENHLFERSLRDVHMAGTHMIVGDVAFESHAQFMLGLPDANAMA